LAAVALAARGFEAAAAAFAEVVLAAVVFPAVVLAARGLEAAAEALAEVVLGFDPARFAAGLAGASASAPAGGSVLDEALRGCGIDAPSRGVLLKSNRAISCSSVLTLQQDSGETLPLG
jgi:hypothetical protein